MLHNIEWDEKLVKEIIAQAFPKERVLGIERCTRGFMNVVLDVSLSNDKHVIVKLSDQPKKHGIEKEAWLFELVAKRGVPVPKVYFKDFSKKRFKYDVLVMEKLRGKSLEDAWKNLSKNDQAALCYKLGELFAKIHSITFNKPGSITVRRLNAQPDFATRLAKVATKDLACARKMRFIPESLLKDAEQLLVRQPRWPKKYCLCHMDFHFWHIFIDDKLEVTGVIDWGFAESGIPSYDFFKPDRWIFNRGGHAKTAFMKGYTATHSLPVDFENQVRFCRIYTDIKFVERLIKTGDEKLAADYVKIIAKNISLAKQ